MRSRIFSCCSLIFLSTGCAYIPWLGKDTPTIQSQSQSHSQSKTQPSQEHNIMAASPASANLEKANAFLAGNANKDGVTVTASGLQYQVLEKGDGTFHPTANSTVEVHYHGELISGQKFDSSYDRNSTISFPLDRVIPGWTEGMQYMKTGDKFRFFIPPNLAYGEAGAGGVIGPNEALIFDVELIGIK